MKDSLNQEIKIGDLIVYGRASGSSPKAFLGQVIRRTNSTLMVLSTESYWGYGAKPYASIRAVDRCVKVPSSMLELLKTDKYYQKRLEAYEKAS